MQQHLIQLVTVQQIEKGGAELKRYAPAGGYGGAAVRLHAYIKAAAASGRRCGAAGKGENFRIIMPAKLHFFVFREKRRNDSAENGRKHKNGYNGNGNCGGCRLCGKEGGAQCNGRIGGVAAAAQPAEPG